MRAFSFFSSLSISTQLNSALVSCARLRVRVSTPFLGCGVYPTRGVQPRLCGSTHLSFQAHACYVSRLGGVPNRERYSASPVRVLAQGPSSLPVPGGTIHLSPQRLGGLAGGSYASFTCEQAQIGEVFSPSSWQDQGCQRHGRSDAWWHQAVSCTSPLSAFRASSGGVVFSELARFGDLTPIQINCGQCLGCRLMRASDWQARLMHEAQLHDLNCFVTLTYDDVHLPPGGSLRYSDVQGFLRKLRLARRPGRVRFYCVGEYGPTTGRAHYHLCIFGTDFLDRVYAGRSSAKPYYKSAELEELWGRGFCTVQPLNPKTAGYAARYVVDKLTGDMGAAHYGDLVPPFARMSLRPGLGGGWFERFASDLRLDHVIVDGRETRVPRYYDKLRERAGDRLVAEHKEARELRAAAHRSDNTPERRAVKAEVLAARVNQLKREL